MLDRCQVNREEMANRRRCQACVMMLFSLLHRDWTILLPADNIRRHGMMGYDLVNYYFICKQTQCRKCNKVIRGKRKLSINIEMNSGDETSQLDPSSFQSSRPMSGPGFTPGLINGYQTPTERVRTCGSCSKEFRIKRTYKRHIKSCSFKRKLSKKRRLDFKTSSEKKKRDLFDECSSSNSDNGQGEDGMYTHCVFLFHIK